MNKISVIITTYNRANLLKDAIESVLGQNFQNFELIVVDDCSSDNTGDIVRKFQDKRISYLKHKKNMGDAAAKNTGIRAARGEYIISLDDDDLMVSWALEELIGQFKKSTKSNLGGVYGWSWWIYNKGKTLKLLTFQKSGKIFKVALKNQIFTNILLKKEVFDTIGFYDETLSSGYDHDFYLRLAKVYDVDFVSRILFVIRVQQQKHLSELSLSHMERYQYITRRFSRGARHHGTLILRFFPASLYFKLSLLKHKIATIIKIIGNAKLKQEVTIIREELMGLGIKI